MQKALRNLKALGSLALVLLAATPLAAEDGGTPTTSPVSTDVEPRWELEFESSPRVVREEEEFLKLRFNTETWRYEVQAGTVNQRYRDSNAQAGIAASRSFGQSDVTGVFRFTDKDLGQDIVAGLHWARQRDEGGGYNVDLVVAQADLASDLFLFSDSETQLSLRGTWQMPSGLEVGVFAADMADYDLMRGSRELLHLLPRGRIAGVETLADITVDEERLESSFGASIAFKHGIVDAEAYAKAGDQTIRGVSAADDFSGFGGHLILTGRTWSARGEVDVRQLETVDNIAFDRARVLVDFAQHIGRFEWGAGMYLQGESETFSEIADIYETAGVGLKLNMETRSGKHIGLWAMTEDNAPDFQKMTRVAFFLNKGDREYGVGIRRDEIGRVRFAEETFGPFVFGRMPFKDKILDGHVGIQDGEVYGRISLGFRR